MNIIVAVDRNWAIGKKGQLLFRIREDLEYFRTLTTGNCVVYGRKTLETFPGGEPLPYRDNVVLTENESFEVDAMVAHNLDELCRIIHDYPTERIYVIGGASVYRQLLPYCDTAYVTKIDASIEGADAFFPNLDIDSNWQMTEEGENQQSGNSVRFRFAKYRNKRPRDF
jgi:dihydrofolate reductase